MSPTAKASTPENPWVDGELFSYIRWRNTWSSRGIKVKFYIMEAEYNSESKKKEVYKRVEEMMKLPGCSNVMTPLFVTYNSQVNRVVICYPHFDQLLKDWLPANEVPVDEHTLPPIWNNLIRALLPCITTFEKLMIRKLEDKSSYVWLKEPNEIRVVLFPEYEKPGGRYLRKLAKFLRECLYRQWNNADLDSFIGMLESHDISLQCITAHPLLQDLDAVSVLIRTTWRSSNLLSPSQKNVLKEVINPTKWGQASLIVNQTQDLALIDLLAAHGNDAAGIFIYVKELCAHYTEKHRKHVMELEAWLPFYAQVLVYSQHQILKVTIKKEESKSSQNCRLCIKSCFHQHYLFLSKFLVFNLSIHNNHVKILSLFLHLDFQIQTSVYVFTQQ